jgi:hypothetical protein
MALNFPNSPSTNDEYSFGGKTWIYTGSAWKIKTDGAINDIVIGNTTPSTGAFTTLSATGTFTGTTVEAAQIGNSGATLTGTLDTAAQTNITSVGTLTGLTLSGTLTGTTINAATIGNTGATIVGATVSAATIGNSGATLTGTLSTAAQTNVTSLGTLTGLTLSGTLTGTTINAATIGNSGATLTGTLSTAAQTNVTSLGTLTGLTLSGTLTGTTVEAAQIGNSGATLTGTLTGDVTGNLTGTAAAATTVVTTLTGTSANYYIPFSLSGAATGNASLGIDAGLYYNPSTNYLFYSTLSGGTILPTAIDFGDGTSGTEHLRFGSSDDVKFFYDGVNNTMEMELESTATSFIITDNATTRFTFEKTNGNLTLNGNVNANSYIIAGDGVFWANGDPYSSGGGASGYFNSSLTTFPGSAGDSDYGSGETYVGESATIDAFQIPIIPNYDMNDPHGSLETVDLGVLT